MAKARRRCLCTTGGLSVHCVKENSTNAVRLAHVYVDLLDLELKSKLVGATRM